MVTVKLPTTAPTCIVNAQNTSNSHAVTLDMCSLVFLVNNRYPTRIPTR